MGRTGRSITGEEILYGHRPVASGSRARRDLLQTVIDHELFAGGRVDWIHSSGKSTVFGVANRDGRNLFLYRPDPDSGKQKLYRPFFEPRPEPTATVQHEQLNESREMFLWQKEDGGWIVSVQKIEPEIMPAALGQVAGSDARLATIRGYPGMAWIELRGRGDHGLVFSEGDKQDPFNPEASVASYPAPVYGEPGDVRAIYNKDRDETIVAWSENRDGAGVVCIWSSIRGAFAASLAGQLPEASSGDIEIHEILDREAGPAVVWSPRDSNFFSIVDEQCVWGEGSMGDLFSGGNELQFGLLEDDRVVFAHRWGGDLMFGEISDRAIPNMTASIPNVEEVKLFGGNRARAVYRAGGKKPGIFQLEADGSTRRISGTESCHVLGGYQGKDEQPAAFLLDRSGEQAEVRSITLR